ncbi:hypothetical protein DRO66_02550 [Candidatus Bathyarchaeota archaeon]|nr:MAG: hypothetical protein DRO66_02550 [Candidatus Bathyarchaeota archaeon]
MAFRIERILAFIFDESKEREDRLKSIHFIKASEAYECSAITALYEYARQGTILSYEHLVREYGLSIPLGESPASLVEVQDMIKHDTEMTEKSRLMARLGQVFQRSQELSLSEIAEMIGDTRKFRAGDNFKKESRTPKQMYEDRKNQPAGLLTNVSQINEVIRGMHKGSMNVFAAFTGGGKTINGIGMSVLNSTQLKYNGLYLTMEVPSEEVQYRRMAAHATLPEWVAKQPPIDYARILSSELTPSEEDYLFNQIQDDMLNTDKYGHFDVVEAHDFDNLTTATMESYIATLPYELDYIVVDYAQLLEFAGGSKMTLDEAIFQFYQMALNCNGKPLCVIMLAQCNREGHKEAVENDGVYSLRALGDSHELERGAYRIIFQFMDDTLEASGEIKIQLAKNRGGRKIVSPITTKFNPKYSLVGDSIIGSGVVNSAINKQGLGNMFYGGSDFVTCW